MVREADKMVALAAPAVAGRAAAEETQVEREETAVVAGVERRRCCHKLRRL